MRLEDRVAVITGAGSGIGRITADTFAQEGANVVIADIDLNAATKALEELTKKGGTGRAEQVDVADPDAVKRLLKNTLAFFSRVDVLVNNAAIEIDKTIEHTTFDEWNRE